MGKSHKLIPGGRIPLPRHELLRVVLGWDAPALAVTLTKSCISLDGSGRIVDVLGGQVIGTKDRMVILDDDYMLDLIDDKGLTYVFSLHCTESLVPVKSLNFSVLDGNGDVFARFDKPAQFGYKSVAMGAINFRKEWRVRGLGIESHATTLLDMLPLLKNAL